MNPILLGKKNRIPVMGDDRKLVQAKQLPIRFLEGVHTDKKEKKKKVRERTMPTQRPSLLPKLVPTFADTGCHVVSVIPTAVFSDFQTGGATFSSK
jgi:hypothetical protein